ncbi:MAG: efflux RND transporter periplasmic adaptor subunit, partial [Hyphomicrobiaceae bacterium]
MRLRLFHIALLVPTLLVPMHALAQGRAAVVLVDTVDQREIRDTQSVIGQLVATQRSEIATRTEGVIEAVTFEVGEHVKKGQTLVTLDKSRFEIEKRAAEASMDVARAGLRIAEAKLKLAELAFSRQEGLRKSTAFSRSRYDDLKQAAVQSRSERSQAEAQILNAQSSLNRALYDLKHAVIVAPFDGVVIERQAQPGQYMNTGNAVATILDVRNLEVEADVPSNIVNGLTIGSKVTAVFEGDVRKSVTIRTAIPVQNVSTRTRPVRFTAKLDGLNASMVAIGSSVTLQLPVSAPRKVISVPKDALLQGRGGWMVYVVSDNKAQPRPVKLGQAVQARIEILSGISVGDVVVVRGNERLRPGQAVRAKH